MAVVASASASASSASWSIFSKKRISLQAQQRPASKFLKFCSVSNVGARTCTSAELQWRQNLPSSVLRNRSRRFSVFMKWGRGSLVGKISGQEHLIPKYLAQTSGKPHQVAGNIVSECKHLKNLIVQTDSNKMKIPWRASSADCARNGLQDPLQNYFLVKDSGGTSVASRFLREMGINVLTVRAKVLEMRGRPYKYIERSVSPPLTESSKKVLEWAVDETRKLGEDFEVTNLHILQGIWAQKGTAGQQILANMGFDDKKAEELAQFARDEIASSSF